MDLILDLWSQTPMLRLAAWWVLGLGIIWAFISASAHVSKRPEEYEPALKAIARLPAPIRSREELRARAGRRLVELHTHRHGGDTAA